MLRSKAHLARLVYVSQKTGNCSVSDLTQILDVARAHNRQKGITGLLCFNGHSFLQVLEGPPEAVNALYNRIVRDSRHSEARLLAYDDTIEAPIFRDWSMGYVHSLDLDPSVLNPFFPEGQFQPETLDGVSALMFLASVARQHHGLDRGRSSDSSASVSTL